MSPPEYLKDKTPLSEDLDDEKLLLGIKMTSHRPLNIFLTKNYSLNFWMTKRRLLNSPVII